MAFFVADTFLGFWRWLFRVALHPLGLFQLKEERFVLFASRVWATDLPLSYQLGAAIQRSKWNMANQSPPAVNWKGIRNVKDPFELAIYPIV